MQAGRWSAARPPRALGLVLGTLGTRAWLASGQPWSLAGQAVTREVRQPLRAAGPQTGARWAAGTHPTSSSSSPFLMAQSV